jgi:hypothetical protein
MKTPGLWKGQAATGVMPSMGVKIEIEEIEKTETGPNSQTPGCLAYIGHFRVIEPPQYKGRRLSEYFMIGTKEDKRAKLDETWNRPEMGPGRLLCVMEKAQVPNDDDDDVWRPAAEGMTCYAHVGIEADRRDGSPRNKVVMYFDEKDEDFVGVGEELAAPGAAPGRKGNERKKARGGDGESRSARGSSARREEPKEPDDDEKEPDDDEPEAKPARGSRRDDKDEDEDDRSKRAAASARGRRGRDQDED